MVIKNEFPEAYVSCNSKLEREVCFELELFRDGLWCVTIEFSVFSAHEMTVEINQKRLKKG